MPDTVTAHRPESRAGGAESRPNGTPHLHVVPPPDDSEVPTSGNQAKAPAETISAGHSGSTTVPVDYVSDSGFRVRLATLWQASRAYWSPPAVFTDRPASLDELRTYAAHAPWTAQQTGIVRGLGVGYYRFVGYPYTVWSRYKEWLVQRPGRLIPALGLLKVAALTGPGQWAVNDIVYPVAQFAGRVFL
jgi:hypothetical protein